MEVPQRRDREYRRRALSQASEEGPSYKRKSRRMEYLVNPVETICHGAGTTGPAGRDHDGDVVKSEPWILRGSSPEVP
jgi:hypothetical protein